MLEEKKEKIQETAIEKEMQRAYIDYAMSVIVSRALPDVRDGLKPVQRRILYTMYLMNLFHNKPTRKTARIVGECMGKFHPHGDVAIYDALVRMAQDFSLRYPLIEGQGNFGSIDGDPPAAMRYTEARLTKISSELLNDIEKETVSFTPNFDNSIKEPVVLPSKLPTLLLNGSQGIAVGMTTNIPPHNFADVSEAILAFLKNPKISIEELIRIIKAPDFPTGGYVSLQGIDDLYKNGKGHLILRGKISVEEKKGKTYLVITELPYQLNKSDLIKKIAELVRQRKLFIHNIRDESAKGKIRIVLELKKAVKPEFTINRLYKYTPLQTRFDAIMIALVNGQPKILNLKEIIEQYILHRKNIVKKRTQFELKKAEERQHIVHGLIIALKNINNVIPIIKKSSNTTEASKLLMKNFKLSQKQAEAILEMKLQKLTKLEIEKLFKENKILREKIIEFKKILASEKRIVDIIKKEILELKRNFSDKRRTKIISSVKEFEEKDLVAKQDVVITFTAKGYIKRMPLKVYKEQKRGGRGIIGTELATEDFVKKLIFCSTHDYLLFFTERGRIYWLKAYEVPESMRYGKGKPIINLLNISDKVTAILSTSKFDSNTILATEKGFVKKMSLKEFSRPRKTGVNAIKLKNDKLIGVELVNKEDILLATEKGNLIRFSSDEIRKMGKTAYGVTGIKLKDDKVVSLATLRDERMSVLTITEKGFGKRTLGKNYRKTKRAGKGITNMKTSERNGNVVGIETVTSDDSIIVSTERGMVIRIKVKDIRIMGRATQGVKIIKLKQNDRVADFVKVQKENFS